MAGAKDADRVTAGWHGGRLLCAQLQNETAVFGGDVNWLEEFQGSCCLAHWVRVDTMEHGKRCYPGP